MVNFNQRPDSAAPFNVSFEFFPPKTSNLESGLWHCVEELKGIAPKFVSVTYGAGGSTRKRTHEIVTRIQNNHGLSSAAHLTCISASRDEIADIARNYWQAGIRHIVALRGDFPEGRNGLCENGYHYAGELVAGLKQIADFEISVAGYPEKHPECPSIAQDIENLKHKIDSGADRVITQFFMNPEDFLRWRDRLAAAGITAPVIPGILPINHFGRAVSFAKRCGTSIPPFMHRLFEGLDARPAMRDHVSVALAYEQCRILAKEGVEDFHFYTLNRPELVKSVCRLLGAGKAC